MTSTRQTRLEGSFAIHRLVGTLRVVLLLAVGLLTPAAMAQPAREFPPSVQPAFNGIQLNGGRVQSIAVSPRDSNHIIAAHQYGGLWQTTNGGRTWFHLNNLQAVSAVDVAYAPDGRTVIATVARDLKAANGGGIWRSADEGETWARATDGSGTVPNTLSGLMRTSAWGISYAPDDANRVYVATDYGIAISRNNGVSWTHQLLDPSGPAARSVQGLPANRAIAVTGGAIYFKDPDDVWRVIRRGSFDMSGFKNIDVSPYDNDKVFILQSYNTLMLYEVSANTWTDIPLPGGGSRGPYVRAARGTTGSQSIDLWVGLGWANYKASCPDLACVRRLRCVRRTDLPPDPCDWRGVGRDQGIHDDTGHLGLDAQKRPVMAGSDGGLFKPQNADGTSWTHASPGGSGMNSYQITSLAGTNYGVGSPPSLYFATQDNALWASPDGGRTWPNSDCAEGWHMQTWHQAASTTDPASRVAYGTTGCWRGPRISDANFFNQRDTTLPPPRPIPGETSTPSEAFILSPGNWLRFEDAHNFFIDRVVGDWIVSLSTDNLERWRGIRLTGLNPNSAIFRRGGALASPTAYATFNGARLDMSGFPLVALARIDDPLRVSAGEITESNLIYLPMNGNLGVRAAEWDWHPVYAVDPGDPNFLLAPDIVNGTVWYSTSGGARWSPDDELTNLVTQGGRLVFYEGNPGQVQVTNITFSPYDRNLIMVGTREAGVIYSEDHGNTWQTIGDSEAMLYVTGFFFGRDGTVYVSTYGRGLWKIDMAWRWREFHVFPICGFNYGDCIVRLPPDPRENVIRNLNWKEYDVLVVFGGRVNGLVPTDKGVKAVTVSPGATYRFYSPTKQPLPEIMESKEGAGFAGDPAAEFALKSQEVITGVILKDGKPFGYLTNKQEFKLDQEPLKPKSSKEFPADKPDPSLPYLSLVTNSRIGPGIARTNDVVAIRGRGLIASAPAEVLLDGKPLTQVKVEKDGRFNYVFKVPEELSLGQHRLEVRQKQQQGERRAVATFVKVRGEDRVKAVK